MVEGWKLISIGFVAMEEHSDINIRYHQGTSFVVCKYCCKLFKADFTNCYSRTYPKILEILFHWGERIAFDHHPVCFNWIDLFNHQVTHALRVEDDRLLILILVASFIIIGMIVIIGVVSCVLLCFEEDIAADVEDQVLWNLVLLYHFITLFLCYFVFLFPF